MAQQAVEDYLKTIYLLAQTESPVTTSRLATARELKPASVTNMVQRLARLDLVSYRKHFGVTLTAAGQKIALEMLRHHRLLELYLTQELGFGWEEVHEEAEALEHVISEKFEARIAAILGDPQFDPHGEPIPTKDGTISMVNDRPLTATSVGEQVEVVRIGDDTNADLLTYLAQQGLVLGCVVLVAAVAPFEGPITVEFEDEQRVVGYKVATNIFVEGVGHEESR